jgi:hypothetical protein
MRSRNYGELEEYGVCLQVSWISIEFDEAATDCKQEMA